MIAEGPLDRLNHDFQRYTILNSCWCAFTTFFTAGYGEILPKTFLGRFFAGGNVIFGVFMASLLVVTLHGFIVMSNAEGNAYTVLKR